MEQGSNGHNTEKGDLLNCAKYRTISLIPHMSNVCFECTIEHSIHKRKYF